MKQITQKDVFKEILKFYPEYDVDALKKETDLEINIHLLDIIDRFKEALHKRT
jgi:hypothetical protein